MSVNPAEVALIVAVFVRSFGYEARLIAGCVLCVSLRCIKVSNLTRWPWCRGSTGFRQSCKPVVDATPESVGAGNLFAGGTPKSCLG